MATEFKNIPPEWQNEGTEPTADKKTNGFQARYKLPAAYLNWIVSLPLKCIKELQEVFKRHESDNQNPHEVTAEQAGALPIQGGELTGELIVNDNFHVRKTFNEIPYRSYIRPINYSIANNGEYSTGIIHYNNGSNHAQLMFNKDGAILRDNVNGKAYQIYGQHNIDLLKALFLPLEGGVLKGNLDLKKVNNGSATIYKNHSDSADFGLVIRDVAANGNYNQLIMSAEENALKYRDTSGQIGVVYTNLSKPYKTGTYTGNGDATRIIDVGFKPSAVLVLDKFGRTNEPNGSSFFVKGGLATASQPVVNISSSSTEAITIVDNGFQVVCNKDSDGNKIHGQTNTSGEKYNYIAFK